MSIQKMNLNDNSLIKHDLYKSQLSTKETEKCIENKKDVIVKFSTKEINTLSKEINTLSSTLNFLDTASSALSNISNNAERMHNIGTQTANSALNDEDIKVLGIEFERIKDEIIHIANGTTFKGVNINTNEHNLDCIKHDKLKHVEFNFSKFNEIVKDISTLEINSETKDNTYKKLMIY